ncbi:MAG TPA: VOC family protein [Candidatus Cybelea sp.]|jgi:predicted enzyme related to lactoylglutathione lyase|nr:VOC family protein [Candidatus Cybelea sp.]
MIEDVAFIAYSVRDVPRAVAFYRDVLGLEIGRTFNEGFVEFDVGASAFAIDGASPGYEPGTCTGVNFEVSDVAAVRERLAAFGVEVSAVYEFPACSVCFATDPDGNRFALHRRRTSNGEFQLAFAGIPVVDYPGAIDWYSRLFDRPPDVVVREDAEAMWRLTATAWVYVVRDAGRAGRALATILLPDLDAFLTAVAGRGIAPPNIETAPGLFRRAAFVDAEGNSVAFGERLDSPKVPALE